VNYFFTTLSDDVEYGLLADLTFENNSLEDVRFHVLNINNYQVNYSPEIVLSYKNGQRLARFFDRPNFGTVAFLPR